MRPGDVVGDRFVVERFTAAGGMGEVYRAIDRHTDGLAALKVVRGGEGAGLERFAREARALAELSHPGIVTYLAHGRTAEGELWLAMEWLEGEDLGARLAVAELSLAETLAVVTGAAAALAAAHARHVVHRDVKPSNLFLVDWRVDRVKLLDFGVARLARLEALTASGMMVGTPLYMAPEQARGARDVDARADVFALGVTLFRCLTGRLPFPGASPAEILSRVASDEPAPRARAVAPEVPAELDELCARLLAKAPAARPRDAAAVLAELLPFEATGLGARGRPAGDALGGDERRVACVVLCAAEPTEALRVAAAAHGAALERVAGGAVARVGGPGLATDHAARAARLALGLRALAPEAGLAVVTARAASSRGSDELTARAARLLAGPPPIVRPRPVRIDEATAGLLGARFEIAGDGVGLVLCGERDPDQAARSLLGRPTPFVGRDRELAQLEAAFDDCVDEGAARVLLVTAPAGAGKSRLRQELVARLARRERPVEVWTGRGDPMRAGAPLALLADAVRRAAGIDGGEPLAQRRALLAARVGRHLAAGPARRVSEFIGELAGVPFAAEDSPQLRAARRDPLLLAEQTRSAWEEWLAAECAAQPLLLILEDLHWGDVPTVRLVDAALRALAERPLLVIGLARPEVHDLFPRIFAERGLAELHLGALPRRAAEALVVQALGERASDAGLVAEVVARAAGNAFYLEELIRHVAAGGVGLPETVLAMAAARFEALGVETRRVLRAASVFGELFWAGGVEALLGGDAADVVEAALAELVDREVVQRRPHPRLAGERELGFRHGLLREAAYAMLTDEDRRRGHRLAGRWLAAAGEPEGIVIAEHLERGGDVEAAGWLLRAAQQALAAGDLDAAIARGGRALERGGGDELAGRVQLLLAETHRGRGDLAAAYEAAVAAAARLPRGGDAWCVAVGEAAASAGKAFDKQALRARVAELDAAPGAAGASPQRVVALARAATQAFLVGEPELGDALLARVDPLPGGLAGEPAVVAALRAARGYRVFCAGDFVRARAEFAAAADALAAAGDRRGACVQRIEAGFHGYHLGQFAEAIAELEPLIAEADRLGLGAAARYGRAYVAMNRLALGDVEGAVVASEGAARGIEGVRAPRVVVGVRHARGMVLEACGRFAEAEAEVRAGVAGGLPAFPPLVWAEATLARLLVARGAVAEGVEVAERALGLLDERRGVCAHELDARLAMAVAARAAGRDDAEALVRLAQRRLGELAGLIEDEETRRGFVERVPAHVAIARLG